MQGARDVFLYATQMVLGVVVPALIVRADIRRLAPRELSRAWPEASIWSAASLVSVLCVPLHVVRTRRTFLGFLLSLAAFGVACLGVIGPTLLLDWVLPG